MLAVAADIVAVFFTIVVVSFVVIVVVIVIVVVVTVVAMLSLSSSSPSSLLLAASVVLFFCSQMCPPSIHRFPFAWIQPCCSLTRLRGDSQKIALHVVYLKEHQSLGALAGTAANQFCNNSTNPPTTPEI